MLFGNGNSQLMGSDGVRRRMQMSEDGVRRISTMGSDGVRRRLPKVAGAALLALALPLGACSPSDAGARDSAASSQVASERESAPVSNANFESWTKDSPTVKVVKEYVEAVTDEKSKDFIPVEDRIVTIDWDGTLYGELDPIYFDWAMFIHRVLWDSTYTPTAEQVEVAHQIEEVERTRVFPEDLEAKHAKYLNQTFEGMSLEDFEKYVAEFAATDAPKFKGLKRKDAYFRPMVELVNYLHDNGFDCYIVSGTDRNVLRVMLAEYLPWIDSAHIKGSVSTVVASGQGDEDGLEYTWDQDDEPVLGGDLVLKDVKANKPEIIEWEIGKQPVMSLGNSSGDFSMANFFVNNNPYRSLAIMLCCDDTERDWGELDKAEKMVASAKENGWHAVSQRDEWTTIYGKGVERDTEWTWSSEVAGPNAASTENKPADAAGEQQAEADKAA